MRKKLDNLIKRMHQCISMKADGSNIHDMNKKFYLLRDTLKQKYKIFDVARQIQSFRLSMSGERRAFKEKPALIIELWDILDDILKEACPHPLKHHGEIGDYKHCTICGTEIKEAQQ